MKTSLQHTARSLQTRFAEAPEKHLGEISQFARRYAPGTALARQAVKLVMKWKQAEPDRRPAYEAELHQLIDEVAKWNEERVESGEMMELRQTRQAVAEQFLRQNPAGNYYDGYDDAMQDQWDRMVEKPVAKRISSKKMPGSSAQKSRAASTERISREKGVGTCVFDCRGVNKTFEQKNSQRFSLEEIDLSLHTSQITGLVGKNGNGKTTLLRIVAGVLAHDEGMVSYPGFRGGTPPIDWFQVKHQIAYVPQELPDWRGSLLNHLRYEAAVHGIRGAENQLEVDFIVERLGLASHLHLSWDKLSGGYKLRFALARALVWRPRLLIADEPIANLDPNTKATVLRDLRDMADSFQHPLAILISSQDIEEVESIADRMVFIEAGKIVLNERREDMGLQRDSNCFELEASIGRKALAELLRNAPIREIRQPGQALLVFAETSYGYTDFLRDLIDLDVAFKACRDISQSTKRLFL